LHDASEAENSRSGVRNWYCPSNHDIIIQIMAAAGAERTAWPSLAPSEKCSKRATRARPSL